MEPKIEFDMREFNNAMRQHLLTTRRELSAAINSRLRALLTRFFVLLPPRNVEAQKEKIRAYMRTPISDPHAIDKRTGKPRGRKRLGIRANLIAQARNKKAGKKGLYGKAMRAAAGRFMGRAVSSAGYLKVPIAKAIKRLSSGHFWQYGKNTKKKQYAGDFMLDRMANQYGLEESARSNVGMMKGAKATVSPARPGLDPSASANLSIILADDQVAAVASRYEQAWAQAVNDERDEIIRHLTDAGQAAADEHNAR